MKKWWKTASYFVVDPWSWKYTTGTPCPSNFPIDIHNMAARENNKINPEFIQSLRNISLKYKVEMFCSRVLPQHSKPLKTKQSWLYWEKLLPLRSGSLLWGKTWLELMTSYKYCPLWVCWGCVMRYRMDVSQRALHWQINHSSWVSDLIQATCAKTGQVKSVIWQASHLSFHIIHYCNMPILLCKYVEKHGNIYIDI